MEYLIMFKISVGICMLLDKINVELFAQNLPLWQDANREISLF